MPPAGDELEVEIDDACWRLSSFCGAAEHCGIQTISSVGLDLVSSSRVWTRIHGIASRQG